MARLLLNVCEPFCKRCCGARKPKARQAAKQRARQVEKRQWRKEEVA